MNMSVPIPNKFEADPTPAPCAHCEYTWAKVLYCETSGPTVAYFVRCPKCAAQGPKKHADAHNWRDRENQQRAAIRAWNRRCHGCADNIHGSQYQAKEALSSAYAWLEHPMTQALLHLVQRIRNDCSAILGDPDADSEWAALYHLFTQYEERHDTPHALHIYGDFSGHMEANEQVVASFDRIQQLVAWLLMAINAPSSVGIAWTSREGEHCMRRVPCHDLAEQVLSLADTDDDTIELYREDVDMVIISSGILRNTWDVQDDTRTLEWDICFEDAVTLAAKCFEEGETDDA